MDRHDLEARFGRLIAHPRFNSSDILIIQRARDEIGQLFAHTDPGTPKILLLLPPYQPDARLLDDLEAVKSRCTSIQGADETIAGAIEEITYLRLKITAK